MVLKKMDKFMVVNQKLPRLLTNSLHNLQILNKAN